MLQLQPPSAHVPKTNAARSGPVLAAFGLLGLGLLPAQAQTGPPPWAFGLNQELAWQDNIFQASPGGAKADLVSTTGLRASLDQTWSRQHYTASASVDRARFRDTPQLSHTAYELAGTLAWASEGRLSGEWGADASANRNAGGSEINLPTDTLNIERTRRVFGRARVGSSTALTFGAGAEALQRDFSAAAADYLKVNQRTLDGNARYQPGPDLGFLASLQQTQGSYPRFSSLFGADRFQSLQATLGSDWTVSGASQLALRIGHSQEAHDLQADRSAWNGSLRWLWKPTYHLNFSSGISRDNTAGQEASASVLSNVSSASVNTTLDGTAQWLLTSKIDLGLALKTTRRAFDQAVVQTFTASGTDRTRSATLTLHYAAMRNLDLNCRLSREQRQADAALVPLLSRPYTAKTVACGGQLWLR
jgi:hypothetical protein